VALAEISDRPWHVERHYRQIEPGLALDALLASSKPAQDARHQDTAGD
jgi:hypothetical protein